MSSLRSFEEKGWITAFPEPPSLLGKTKLSSDSRAQISKPHPIVLPEFVAAPYNDELTRANGEYYDHTYERNTASTDHRLEGQQLPTTSYPQLSLTRPTPSNSESSNFSGQSTETSALDYVDSQRHLYMASESRSFPNAVDILPVCGLKCCNAFLILNSLLEASTTCIASTRTSPAQEIGPEATSAGYN
jgi:hypothetical protein